MNKNRFINNPKIDTAALAHFWPPSGETFFIAIVRSIQVLCLLGSLIAGVNFLTKWQGGANIWLPCALFAAHLLSFYRGLWLEENLKPNHLLVVVSELVVIGLVVAVFNQVLAFGTSNILGFLPWFVLIASAWQMGRSWLRSYYYLFVQPNDLTKEEGGIPFLIRPSPAFSDHREAFQSLKSAVYWLGGIQVTLVLTSVSLANYFEKDTIETIRFSNTVIIFGAVHLLLCLPLLAWLRLRYLRTGWQLSHLVEPARLQTRWGFYLVALALFSLGPALLLSNIDLSGLTRIFKFTASSSQTEAPVPLTPQPFQTLPKPVLPQSTGNTGGPDLSGLLAFISNFLILLFLVGFIFLVVLMLIQAGWVGPRLNKLKLGTVWTNFWKWAVGLFGKRRKREGFSRGSTAQENRNSFWNFRRDRLPNDARGKIRFYYRHLLRRAAKAGVPRRTGQTPEEYAGLLRLELEEAQMEMEITTITGLYEEARFSPHKIMEEQTEEARRSSEKLIAYFRFISRHKANSSSKKEAL